MHIAMNRRCRMRRGRGFNALELLVCIAVILILLGLIFPALSRVRQQSNRVACVGNLRQIGLAVHNYALTYDGFLPPVGSAHNRAQYAYLMYDKGVGFENLGLLQKEKFIPYNSKVFLCPDHADEYNMKPNIWTPPDLQASDANLVGGWVYHRSTYVARIFDGYAVDPGLTLTTRLPTLQPNQAMYADVFNNSDRVKEAHGNGINVLFVDGHVKFRPLDPTKELASVSSMSSSYNTLYDTVLWPSLDDK